MNRTIEVLLKEKETNEKELKIKESELKILKRTIDDELNKETRLLNEVLKHSLTQIIEMIHKAGLKCSCVRNTETIWGDTEYKISDDFYFVNIIAKDGKIVTDYTGIDNDGGGKNLHKKAQDLINFKIAPFCEQEKHKYNRE